MGCWINPAKTVLRKQQVKRAITDAQHSFTHTDFFQNQDQMSLLLAALPSTATKLVSNAHPYRLDQPMKVIRKISTSRQLWFDTTSFSKCETGDIICTGDIIKLWQKRNDLGQYCFKRRNTIQAMEVYKRNQHIYLSNLSFSNDFLYKDTSDSSDVAGWLFEWLL